MKTIICLFVSVLLILCCSKNKHEKIISNYVQTDKYGTWTDLKFKSIEIKELEPIRISDSISILKNGFNVEIKKKLNSFEIQLQKSKKGLEQEENSKIRLQTLVDMYNKDIDRMQHAIDSLKTLQFTSIYMNELPDKILLHPVQCKFSYISPIVNTRQEQTAIFYITPEGICLESIQVK